MDCKVKPKSNNDIFLLLFFLIVLDYIITYYGMYVLDCISEVNPLMINFMALHFIPGVFLRIILAGSLVALLKFAEKKLRYKMNYRSLLFKIISIQGIPYAFHTIWIFSYLKAISV